MPESTPFKSPFNNASKRIVNDEFCDSSSTEQSKEDSSLLALTECSDTENQGLNNVRFMERDEKNATVKSRKNRKKNSVQFWKLRTLASEDFDPSRLTERQQIAYFAAQTATDKKNQLASSPFRLDRLMADTEVPSAVGVAPPVIEGANSSLPLVNRPRNSKSRSPLTKSKGAGSANHNRSEKKPASKNLSTQQPHDAVMPRTPHGFENAGQAFYSFKNKISSPSTTSWSNIAAGSSVQDVLMDDEPLSSTLGLVVEQQPLTLPSSVLDVDIVDVPLPVSLNKSALLFPRPVPLSTPLIATAEASRLMLSEDNSVDDTFNSSCPDDVVIRRSSEDHSTGKQICHSQSFSSLEVQIAQFLASCDAVRRQKSEIAASFRI